MSKFIIVATMPSGNKYAFSGYEGTFAIVPIDGDSGMVRGCFGWDTHHDAQKYMDTQLEMAPELATAFETIKVLECVEPH